jgi:hypothetical protein
VLLTSRDKQPPFELVLARAILWFGQAVYATCSHCLSTVEIPASVVASTGGTFYCRACGRQLTVPVPSTIGEPDAGAPALAQPRDMNPARRSSKNASLVIGAAVVVFLAMGTLMSRKASEARDARVQAEQDKRREEKRLQGEVERKIAHARALEGLLPEVEAYAARTAEVIRGLINDRKYDDALRLIAVVDESLGVHARAAASGEIADGARVLSLATEIAALREQATKFAAAREHAEAARLWLERGDRVAKEGDWLAADSAYSSAISDWNSVPSELEVELGVSGWDAVLAARRTKIERQVARLKAAQAAAERSRARQFRLGGFYYWLGEPEFRECIGGYSRTCAGAGGEFVVLPYTIENEGQSTATTFTQDFVLLDSSGREFQSSAEGRTALIMSGRRGDLGITQLNPGVQKRMWQVFEVPTNASGLRVVVYEKGVLGTGRKELPL